ncbi:hypothetical protein Smp_162420 [Schistosoma mansoni]|uniref:Transcriptional regulator n=1 Tax=Schistosoma mansoni TaxID=6183 RepID=G4LZB6_SCHMA|nr:hypothetical protein Smp_162420 [Schistosoma mansoni]|eukprot:XP_018646591.1 hypothetical protein Smp_162420 [Schistosoma mansoni]
MSKRLPSSVTEQYRLSYVRAVVDHLDDDIIYRLTSYRKTSMSLQPVSFDLLKKRA